MKKIVIINLSLNQKKIKVVRKTVRYGISEKDIKNYAIYMQKTASPIK